MCHVHAVPTACRFGCHVRCWEIYELRRTRKTVHLTTSCSQQWRDPVITHEKPQFIRHAPDFIYSKSIKYFLVSPNKRMPSLNAISHLCWCPSRLITWYEEPFYICKSVSTRKWSSLVATAITWNLILLK